MKTARSLEEYFASPMDTENESRHMDEIGEGIDSPQHDLLLAIRLGIREKLDAKKGLQASENQNKESGFDCFFLE